MPLVKLTFKHEPVQVDDDELEALRGQGVVEKVLDEPQGKPAVTPAPAGKPEEKQ